MLHQQKRPELSGNFCFFVYSSLENWQAERLVGGEATATVPIITLLNYVLARLKFLWYNIVVQLQHNAMLYLLIGDAVCHS